QHQHATQQRPVQQILQLQLLQQQRRQSSLSSYSTQARHNNPLSFSENVATMLGDGQDFLTDETANSQRFDNDRGSNRLNNHQKSNNQKPNIDKGKKSSFVNINDDDDDDDGGGGGDDGGDDNDGDDDDGESIGKSIVVVD